MNHKERQIAEKRSIQATQKNFMGATGKLGVIAKIFGQEIIRQGSPSYDVNYLDDPFDEQNPDDIPYFNEENEHLTIDGYCFDGTSSGIHLEIKIMAVDSRLSATWKGDLVYSEMAGDLLAYVPGDDWEGWVNKLFTRAKAKSYEIYEIKKENIEIESKSRAAQFMDMLKKKWGF